MIIRARPFHVSLYMFAGLLQMVLASSAYALDRIELPPAREVFLSPDKNYKFVITMKGPDKEWMANGSTGMLISGTSKDSQQLWEMNLPQGLRPRYAFVNNRGNVILIDQWINATSKHAIMLINPQGNVIAQHSFKNIAETLGVTGLEMIKQSRFGSWLMTPPVPDSKYDSIIAKAAGKTLYIQFTDGTLKQ